jgi:restriction system protein
MAEKETTVWGIHAGAKAEADALFLKKGCIALGWTRMGDLAVLSPTRAAFRGRFEECYPETKPGAIAAVAGVPFRFVHEMKTGDIVVYPSKVDRQVHLGEVTGPYRYDPSGDSTGYCHRREVKWLRAVPRTRFSQGALYEIGSAITLFQVKTYADEFLAALEGQTAPPPLTEDETVALVAEEIEQNTRDFVLKKVAQDLKGHPFAEFVAHLLQVMGYRTRVSPPGTDAGVDIIAHRDELGFEPPIIKVQVKATEGNIGDPVVSALYGKVGTGEYGLLVTLGAFTNQAKGFAREKSNLRLMDGIEFVDLVLQHYEELDSRYKGLIPLKRVYVPQALEEEGE